jgi:solute carrier family 12 (sodium/potassium/chloride transporter), member 2
MTKTGGNQFGTFKGVFTPSILTILGVIMYLRFGWVLGNLGLPLTLLAVTIATSVTFLTGLSLAATATNMRIGGGGAYYIISRSLGIEIGSAIGVPLFLAQSIGVAFYISGFAEAFTQVIPVDFITRHLPFAMSPEKFVSITTLVLLTSIALVSANLALKTQMLILVLIGLSLISFFLGSSASIPSVSGLEHTLTKLPFWVVFAVFFPAVTGIEAGISMSGDLKDPSKALPRGTLGSVLAGYIIYMLIPLFLVRLVPNRQILMQDSMIMQQVARWGVLIVLGVWAATLSSALGCILGAPRTLQALSRDRVLPRLLGRGYGPAQEPRNAMVLTFLVALTAILLGDLNLLAPVLTMFFLTSYGLINLSAGLEGLIDSPTWRPTFRVRPLICLTGALICLLIMLMIDAGATFVATAVTGAIYFWMKRRNLGAQWGDMRYGILMLLARFAIGRLTHRQEAIERSWRPNILVLSGSPQKRWYLIELARALVRGPSCVTVATVVPPSEGGPNRVRELQNTIQAFLRKRDTDALVKVVVEEDSIRGMEVLVKGYGFGPITPNLILMGETVDPNAIDRFAALIQQIHTLHRSLVLVREPLDDGPPAASSGRIDIWWRGRQSNIGLTLTLAYLLQRGGYFENARISIKRIAENETEPEFTEAALREHIQAQRLDVEVETVVRTGDGSIMSQIRAVSADAALVCMGLRPPETDETPESYAAYYRGLIAATDGLPLMLVLSAGEVDYRAIIGLR